MRFTIIVVTILFCIAYNANGMRIRDHINPVENHIVNSDFQAISNNGHLRKTYNNFHLTTNGFRIRNISQSTRPGVIEDTMKFYFNKHKSDDYDDSNEDDGQWNTDAETTEQPLEAVNQAPSEWYSEPTVNLIPKWGQEPLGNNRNNIHTNVNSKNNCARLNQILSNMHKLSRKFRIECRR